MRPRNAAAGDRVAGVLLGLAAGDRIGGPIRMAIQLAESLVHRGDFDLSDIRRRYLRWWRQGGFDTGPTAARVLKLVHGGLSFERAATAVDEELGGRTAGCNPAHRCAPLAVCRAIADSELAAAARAEARLTHRHPLAGDAAAAVARLCRALVRGVGWSEALEWAGRGRRPETRGALRPGAETLSSSGFAPAALQAAIHFVGSSASFGEALDRALDFAGAANYCPVLVGSIGGARWGRAAIGDARVDHHADLLPRIEAAARALARPWGSFGA